MLQRVETMRTKTRRRMALQLTVMVRPKAAGEDLSTEGPGGELVRVALPQEAELWATEQSLELVLATVKQRETVFQQIVHVSTRKFSRKLVPNTYMHFG